MRRENLLAQFWIEFKERRYAEAAHVLNIIGIYDEIISEEDENALSR